MSLFPERTPQREAVDALITAGRAYEDQKRFMMERAKRSPANKAIFDGLEAKRMAVIRRLVQLVGRLKREQIHSDSVIPL